MMRLVYERYKDALEQLAAGRETVVTKTIGQRGEEGATYIGSKRMSRRRMKQFARNVLVGAKE